MKLAFFGLPMAALALLREGHEVALAAICRERAPGTRRLQRALGMHNVLIRPRADDPALAARVASLAPELVVSWFWTTLLPPSIVAAARHGAFGVHPSLLPRWRGPDPYFWAIEAGDLVTGVTAHRIAEGYDTGAILGRREVPLDGRWDAWRLARALDRPSLELMIEVMSAFARGAPPVDEPQDERAATDAPAPDDDLLSIDWNLPAPAIERRVRAAAPYPGAFTFIGEEALVVTRAEACAAPQSLRGLAPGDAALVDGRGLVVAAEGAVALLAGRVIRDDDTEKAVDSGEIAALVTAAKVHPDGDSG